MKIEPGNIFWYSSKVDRTSIPHPHVVLECPVENHEKSPSVRICRITSNMKKISWPGIVPLNEGEGNLTKTSLVDTSFVLEIPAADLGEFIGKLSQKRMNQIFSAMNLILPLRNR